MYVLNFTSDVVYTLTEDVAILVILMILISVTVTESLKAQERRLKTTHVSVNKPVTALTHCWSVQWI